MKVFDDLIQDENPSLFLHVMKPNQMNKYLNENGKRGEGGGQREGVKRYGRNDCIRSTQKCH